MVTPLDPFFEAFVADPLTGIILGAAAVLMLLGPEALLATLYLRPVLGRKLRKDYQESVAAGEWDPAMERVTAPLKEDLAELKALVETEDLEARIAQVFTRLEELDQALETRLEALTAPMEAQLSEIDVAFGKHIQALYDRVDALPERLKMSAQGSKGVEMREVYKAANAAEEDLVDAYVADLSPEERIAARLDSMEPSEEYTKKHPTGSMIVRGIRDMAVEMLRERRGDVINMRRVGPGQGRFASVYGK